MALSDAIFRLMLDEKEKEVSNSGRRFNSKQEAFGSMGEKFFEMTDDFERLREHTYKNYLSARGDDEKFALNSINSTALFIANEAIQIAAAALKAMDGYERMVVDE